MTLRDWAILQGERELQGGEKKHKMLLFERTVKADGHWAWDIPEAQWDAEYEKFRQTFIT